MIVGIDRDAGNLAELPVGGNLWPRWIDTKGRHIARRVYLCSEDHEPDSNPSSWQHDVSMLVRLTTSAKATAGQEAGHYMATDYGRD